MVEKIGEGLIKMGALKDEQREIILNMQDKGDDRLFGEIAISLDFIDDNILFDYLNSLTL